MQTTKGGNMAKLLKSGATKLPLVLGVGILTVAFAGLGAAAVGLSFPLAAEAAVAGVGMTLAGRFL